MKTLALFAAVALLATLASATWTIEAPNIATILMGLSCSTPRLCFAGAGQNGVGVLAFSYNGTTWSRVPIDPQPAQMMFLSTAANPQGNAVIAGMGSPGAQAGNFRGFLNSEIPGAMITVTQNAQYVRNAPNMFAFVGDFVGEESGEGVAVSRDGGKTFSLNAIPPEHLHGWARYATYPDANHWVVSTGAWSTAFNSRAANGVHHLTSRLSVATDANVVTGFRVNMDLNPRVASDFNGYKAGITVTTDAGRTWRRVFSMDGYYFNQVKCSQGRVCYVVGEGRSAVIYKSVDRGLTWNQIYESPAHLDIDLMGLEVLSDNEVWACGMQVENRNMIGMFMHSTDGGRTWETSTLLGYFCVDMSFPSRTMAKAALIDPNGQSHIGSWTA